MFKFKGGYYNIENIERVEKLSEVMGNGLASGVAVIGLMGTRYIHCQEGDSENELTAKFVASVNAATANNVQLWR